MTDTTRNLIQRLADELDAETGYTIYNTGERITHPDVVEARAYLAHPEPEDKVLARVEFAKRDFNGPSDVILAKYCDDWFYGDPERTEVDPVDLCRGAIELFAQTPAPIPLSEGLPNPGDCNAKGYCWVHDLHGNWCLIHYRAVKPSGFSHWLPYWALPEPQNGGDND